MTANGDQGRRPRGNAYRKFARVAGSFLIDYIAVALILLIATVVFEHSLERHKPQILTFQTHLRQAVEHLNPMNLYKYLFDDLGSSLWKPVGAFFDGLDGMMSRISTWAESTMKIPHVFVLLLAFPVFLTTGIVKVALTFFILFFILASSPAALPIIVVSKGSAVEASLVLVIFLPLWVLFGRAILRADRGTEVWVRAFLWFLMSFWALVVTALFYLLVQGAMWASLWAVGQLSPAAPTGAAASAYISFAIRCVGKTAEHSLTEQVVDVVKSRLLRMS